MHNGIFITGTDTNVGKTVLAALLCAALRGTYWKPIQTGAREGTDREQVKIWAGLDDAQTLPESFLFDDPVSPHLAARLAGQEIILERIKAPAAKLDQPLVVEGAGGVMVPINARQFMTDLVRHLNLPVVLAARSTLGTINHTLLSLGCLRSNGAQVLGVVVIGPENLENTHAIELYGKAQVIGQIPVLDHINRETLREVYARHFTRRAFL
jgi:dethiobiotin synthetase